MSKYTERGGKVCNFIRSSSRIKLPETDELKDTFVRRVEVFVEAPVEDVGDV